MPPDRPGAARDFEHRLHVPPRVAERRVPEHQLAHRHVDRAQARRRARPLARHLHELLRLGARPRRVVERRRVVVLVSVLARAADRLRVARQDAREVHRAVRERLEAIVHERQARPRERARAVREHERLARRAASSSSAAPRRSSARARPPRGTPRPPRATAPVSSSAASAVSVARTASSAWSARASASASSQSASARTCGGALDASDARAPEERDGALVRARSDGLVRRLDRVRNPELGPRDRRRRLVLAGDERFEPRPAISGDLERLGDPTVKPGAQVRLDPVVDDAPDERVRGLVAIVLRRRGEGRCRRPLRLPSGASRPPSSLTARRSAAIARLRGRRGDPQRRAPRARRDARTASPRPRAPRAGRRAAAS